MKARSYLIHVVALAMTFTFGCTGAGGCNEINPPPAPMPPSQIVENGMQVRITAQGMETIKQVASDIAIAEVDNISFVPEFWVGDSNHQYGIDFCPTGCGFGLRNLEISMDVDDVTDDSNNLEQCRDGIMAPNQCDEITFDISADISIDFDIDVYFAGNNISDDCQLQIGFHNDPFEGTVGIGLRTRPSDGQLRFDINSITDLDFSGLQMSLENCIPVVEDFLNAMLLDRMGQYIEMLQAFVGDALVQWIANNIIIPLLQPTLDKLFPDPMGLEAALRLNDFMTTAGWLTDDATLEMFLVSGGYVDIHNGGLTAGIITGFNSDADPSTRSELADTNGVKEFAENARCVPPFPTFDLSLEGVPHVPNVSGADPDRPKRFKRDIITEFNGQYDQAFLMFENGEQADVGIAVTQEMLNLAAFHLVNSGGLCLTMGIEHNPLLTVGSFAVIVPSLSELVDPAVGDAPLRLVLRPQAPIQVTFGSGEDTSLIDLYFQDLRLDIYPYVKGRYARAVTFALSMHVPVDLEEGVDDEGNVTVMPVLRQVAAEDIQADVLNAGLLREDPEQLKQILPSVIGMLMPLLAGTLQPIPLPNYTIERMNSQGQTLPWKIVKLSNLEFKPNQTQDALLILAKLTEEIPGQKRLERPFEFAAEVTESKTYSPEELRATMAGRADRRPYVIVSFDREGEYQYSLDGGAWHPFVRGTRMRIEDPALFIQGRHTIRVRGRQAGRPQTLNLEPVEFEVVMDSVEPNVYAKVYGDRIEISAYDYVWKKDVRLSYSTDGGNTWHQVDGAKIELPRNVTKVAVRAEDGSGNVAMHTFSFEPSEEGGCSTSGGSPSLPMWAAAAMALAWVMSRRRRHFLPFVVLAVVALLASGCADKSGKGGDDEVMCTTDVECAGLSCPSGQAPMCIDYMCQCMDDVPYGTPGTYQSMAYKDGLVWVASYNERYGDLMLSYVDVQSTEGVIIKPWQWQFVDGVPEGPVSFPNSDIRGGIIAPGEDVGRYVSLETLSDNHTLLAAYHNATLGALRVGLTTDGTTWTIYDLDDGGDNTGPDFGNAGLYPSVDIDPNGHVGIAYAVNSIQGTANLRSEVRLAISRSTNPQGPEDWDIVTVGTLEYPYPEDESQLDDWPAGALFVKLRFFGDGRAAISWYDQYAGELHFAYQQDVGGQFTETVVAGPERGLGMGLFADFDIDPTDENHIYFIYQDEHQHTLRMAELNLNSLEAAETVVDDGFRPEDGTNQAGLPEPVQHWFGADPRISVMSTKIFMAWQDATTEELYFAEVDRADGTMTVKVLSSHDVGPTEGSKGFFVDMLNLGKALYISAYGVNLKAEPDVFGNPPVSHFVEVFYYPTGVVE